MVDVLENFTLKSSEIAANKLDKVKDENKSSIEKIDENLRLVREMESEDEDDEDDEYDVDEDEENRSSVRLLRRSKTMPTSSEISESTSRLLGLNKSLKENSIIMQSCNNLSSTVNLKLNLNSDRLKMAKDEAERAIKVRLNLFFINLLVISNLYMCPGEKDILNCRTLRFAAKGVEKTRMGGKVRKSRLKIEQTSVVQFFIVFVGV